MKIFKNINKGGKCIICNTNKDGEVTLLGIDGIDGTEEGNNEEALQVHIDCLELRWNLTAKLIYQKVI